MADPAAPGGLQDLRFGDERDWFFQKRFGLFIHWGIYSIGGWHEQQLWRMRMSRADYARFAQQWNPTRFSPDDWLDLMEAAGMKYVCLTTKHHDGFCLWDTTQTTFNTMNTPYGRDIVRMLADACHRRDVPLCLYYSVTDWHHRNYPNQGRHHELPPQAGDEPDWSKYMDYLRNQVRELCTNYGKISGFWWDMNVPGHVDPTVNDMIRGLQPSSVINDRGFDKGDFGTPERDYERDDAVAFTRRTEACQSVGVESWGYRKDEDYYSDRHLMRSIDRYLARGANYLLNVGPKADGSIALPQQAILRRIGQWYGSVRESLEDAIPCSHLTSNRNVLLTRRANTLYVHLPHDASASAMKLPPIDLAPRRATLLNTGRPIDFAVELLPSEHATQRPCLRLRNLPIDQMANTAAVFRLDFERLPEAISPSTAGAVILQF